MNCPRARELMLEAEPTELSEAGTGPLPDHLRTCAECRSAARLLLAAQVGLAAAGERRRRVPDPLLLARKAGRAGEGERRRWFQRPVALIPLAAAATLAVLLLRPGDPAAPPRPAATASAVLEIDVQLPRDRPAAVFQTGDPNVVVVWFF